MFNDSLIPVPVANLVQMNTVNGMVADWDKDQAYWAFYVGDEYASVGVDRINVTQDAVYKLVYTK